MMLAPVTTASRRTAATLALALALSVGGNGCAGIAPAAGGGAAPASSTVRARDPAALGVMTFNIRFGTAPDGDDAWPNRRALALGVIRAFDPSLLALQEALRFQLDEIE